jgi:hypothetical protein
LTVAAGLRGGRARPGPGARVVGRPRVVSVIGFGCILGIGVSVLADGSAAALVIGGFTAAVAVCGLVVTVSTRVWVDGAKLHVRRLGRDARPLRLDRLTRAELSHPGADSGRSLSLADADGVTLRLDATNVRLERLYEVLAAHIRHDDPVADQPLQRRMAKYRPGLPLGPG